MNDQWYFEIGDGQTYGPYPLAKLQKWATTGNLMPTHPVRNIDSTEWTIAAYVPGLEMTAAAPAEEPLSEEADSNRPATFRGKLGAIGRVITGNRAAAVAAAAKTNTGQPDIIEICDEILEVAFERRASDIHIDPEESIVLIQFRVDGGLEPLRKLPKVLLSPIVGRFKVLSRMNIADHRSPQDGQFRYELGPRKQKVDIRVACLPTTHGERLTLRLLAVETEQLTMNRLGMSSSDMTKFTLAAGERQGMVLLTGPTGSGKSTTLYAALRHRLAHHPGRIITVEDPVEFDIVGVSQVETDSGNKVGFSSVLRNILRSDPDVIMIGEIRDYESADVAIKAALTGHLVFSSLHTNSAPSVVTRLVDMGIDPYLVAATLRLCVAQRLVRRLCSKCRQPRELTVAEAETLGQPAIAGKTIYEAAPQGCAACHERGYRGRIGLFELLPVTEAVGKMIVGDCNEADIVEFQKQQHWPRIFEDAILKLLRGRTSLSEVVGFAS